MQYNTIQYNTIQYNTIQYIRQISTQPFMERYRELCNTTQLNLHGYDKRHNYAMLTVPFFMKKQNKKRNDIPFTFRLFGINIDSRPVNPICSLANHILSIIFNVVESVYFSIWRRWYARKWRGTLFVCLSVCLSGCLFVAFLLSFICLFSISEPLLFHNNSPYKTTYWVRVAKSVQTSFGYRISNFILYITLF